VTKFSKKIITSGDLEVWNLFFLITLSPIHLEPRRSTLKFGAADADYIASDDTMTDELKRILNVSVTR
jgi:hypothetical protein